MYALYPLKLCLIATQQPLIFGPVVLLHTTGVYNCQHHSYCLTDDLWFRMGASKYIDQRRSKI